LRPPILAPRRVAYVLVLIVPLPSAGPSVLRISVLGTVLVINPSIEVVSARVGLRRRSGIGAAPSPRRPLSRGARFAPGRARAGLAEAAGFVFRRGR
jgi:hypothetical protein